MLSKYKTRLDIFFRSNIIIFFIHTILYFQILCLYNIIRHLKQQLFQYDTNVPPVSEFNIASEDDKVIKDRTELNTCKYNRKETQKWSIFKVQGP